MREFMTYDQQPYFIFKNKHSIVDMECFTEYLPDISPVQIYESKKVKGRSGRLNITYGDYDSFEYSIEIQLADFERLNEVKQWLRGQGQLILSHDPDRYRMALVTNSSKPIQFDNEDGFFWKFTITFQLEPFKHPVVDVYASLEKGVTKIDNDGDEISRPLIEIFSSGGDLTINWEKGEFVLLNTPKGKLTVDSETGLVLSDGKRIKNKGSRPLLLKGFNNIEILGNYTNASILRRCVFL